MAPSELFTRRQAALSFGLPLFALLLLLVALPLIRGAETLVLRDVLNSHMPIKWSQALAMRSGTFPLLDPYRAGGQPIAGNPNAVPFYPDNLLYLTASPLWALNAHFWIHLLIAPWAFYALARAWGLERAPSWAAAACYTVSGFFLSHLNFYNLVAGAALAPLLVAIVLRMVESPRRLALLTPALAAIWALLVLAGDPQTALLAFVLAASAALMQRGAVPRGERFQRVFLVAAAFGCGTLLALPQLVEFLRILPGSFRGQQGYSASAVLTSSWDPRQVAEWLLPLIYGRPDTIHFSAFWGQKFYTGVPPYFLSLYPGLLSLGLVVAAGFRRQRAYLWSWGAILIGGFLALGRFNPAGYWIFVTATHKALRYPVKFWLLVAVGASLLCGLGFQRLARGEAGVERRLRATLVFLGTLLAGFWVFLALFPKPAERSLTYFIPRTAAFIAHERIRWTGLCLDSLGLLALILLLLYARRRFPAAACALLLAVHAISQLTFLAPLYTTDAVEPYKVPPPALAEIPADAIVANPDFNHLFGTSTLTAGKFPYNHTLWLERRSAYELYPFSGPRWGRRYELNCSPEGLDSYGAREAQNEIKEIGDPAKRTRMLAAWGVSRLLLNHPLDPIPSNLRLLTSLPSFGKTLYVYEIVDRADEAALVRHVYSEVSPKLAFQRLADVSFDPRADAVVVGGAAAEGAPFRTTGGGTAKVLQRDAEEWRVETEAGPGGSLLVVQRSNVLFDATLDGQEVPVLTANGYRVGIEVPEGKHRVHLFVDRKPFHQSLLGALLGVLLLPLLALRGREASRLADVGRTA